MIGIFVSMLILFVNGRCVGQHMKLVGTHILYRHGDRSPVRLYPTSNSSPTKWPNGLGQLTTRGQLQQVRLGRYLRKRYSDLLNSSYVAAEVTIRSTDFDRTLMSAYANLVGLYPTSNEMLEEMLQETDDHHWPSGLPWQPIPVHTVPTAYDHLFSISECPRYDELMRELRKNEQLQTWNRHYQEFFDQLTSWTGMKINDIFDAVNVADIILIENLYHLNPPWATSNVLEQLKHILELSFFYRYHYSPEISRIRGGPMIADIMNNIDNLINNRENGRKAKIYSGHDSTIAGVLSFLSVNYIHHPPYCSTLFFDLYYKADDDTYALKMEYMNSTNGYITEALRFPPCSNTMCPIETLKLWLKTRLPNADMNQECMAKNQH